MAPGDPENAIAVSDDDEISTEPAASTTQYPPHDSMPLGATAGDGKKGGKPPPQTDLQTGIESAFKAGRAVYVPIHAQTMTSRDSGLISNIASFASIPARAVVTPAL
jgi:hypothetical protein